MLAGTASIGLVMLCPARLEVEGHGHQGSRDGAKSRVGDQCGEDARQKQPMPALRIVYLLRALPAPELWKEYAA